MSIEQKLRRYLQQKSPTAPAAQIEETIRTVMPGAARMQELMQAKMGDGSDYADAVITVFKDKDTRTEEAAGSNPSRRTNLGRGHW